MRAWSPGSASCGVTADPRLGLHAFQFSAAATHLSPLRLTLQLSGAMIGMTAITLPGVVRTDACPCTLYSSDRVRLTTNPISH